MEMAEGEGEDEREDIWDDSALVNAYNRSVQEYWEQHDSSYAAKLGSKSKHKRKKRKENTNHQSINSQEDFKEVNKEQTHEKTNHISTATSTSTPVSSSTSVSSASNSQIPLTESFHSNKQDSYDSTSYYYPFGHTQHPYHSHYYHPYHQSCTKPVATSLKDNATNSLSIDSTVQEKETTTNVPTSSTDTNQAQSDSQTQSQFVFPAELPPIPPHLKQDEALSHLLLSWYYAGYYTGRYQFLQGK